MTSATITNQAISAHGELVRRGRVEGTDGESVRRTDDEAHEAGANTVAESKASGVHGLSGAQLTELSGVEITNPRFTPFEKRTPKTSTPAVALKTNKGRPAKAHDRSNPLGLTKAQVKARQRILDFLQEGYGDEKCRERSEAYREFMDMARIPRILGRNETTDLPTVVRGTKQQVTVGDPKALKAFKI